MMASIERSPRRAAQPAGWLYLATQLRDIGFGVGLVFFGKACLATAG